MGKLGLPATLDETIAATAGKIRRDGWIYLPARSVFAILPVLDPMDWQVFAESWNRLDTDIFMADGGRYRRRRHAVINLVRGKFTILPREPHYQSLEHNPLNGGIPRWFSAVEEGVMAGAALWALIDLCSAMFGLEGNCPRIEVHQFRIEAGDGSGLPTPEGMHRDGVDWVGVFLVSRKNISAGTTQIKVDGHEMLLEFTLTNPLDAVLINDRRVMHAVTPIDRHKGSQPAFRDVLVLTFAGAGHSTALAET
jgi:hypothetical protein